RRRTWRRVARLRHARERAEHTAPSTTYILGVDAAWRNDGSQRGLPPILPAIEAITRRADCPFETDIPSGALLYSFYEQLPHGGRSGSDDETAITQRCSAADPREGSGRANLVRLLPRSRRCAHAELED